MDEKQALELILSLPSDQLAKAVKDAKGLEGIRIIKDLWEDFHAIPARDDTKTGPAMHSQGAGADKAIAEYSNPSPQVGIAEQYDKFTQQNIEGWGKMHSAFKSFGDEMKEGFGALLAALKKDPDPDPDPDPVKKDPDPDPDPDPKKKNPDPDPDPDPKKKADLVSSLWDSLGELEGAFAKAEEHEDHDEKKDKEGLHEAREHIEKAEKEIEKVEEHEKKEEAKSASIKAQVQINLGWMALSKATGLSRYDLHGFGNQSDDSVHGDSTADQSKQDLKKAEAKANYFTLKAERLRKSLGMAPLKKDPDPDPDPDPVKKDPDPDPDPDPKKKNPDPDPDPDPKSKAELVALKTELQKSAEQTKQLTERVALLNSRMAEVTGSRVTPMVPVILKSNGIQSEGVASSLDSKIETSLEAGELTEDGAGIARSIVQRYMAAGKGYIGVDIVNQQLERAPIEVQNFFSHLEVTA